MQLKQLLWIVEESHSWYLSFSIEVIHHAHQIVFSESASISNESEQEFRKKKILLYCQQFHPARISNTQQARESQKQFTFVILIIPSTPDDLPSDYTIY